MINGRITIAAIDYEKSFQGIFPALMKKAQSANNPGMALRFLNKMGEDSLPILLDILGNMNEKEKETVLLAVINLFQDRICKVLNKYLSAHDLGEALQMEEIYAVEACGTEGIFFITAGVKVDYELLLNSDFANESIDKYADKITGKLGIKGGSFFSGAAKLALKTSVKIAPDEVEKKGVDLLNRTEMNEKMIELLMGGLADAGLYMTIQGIDLAQESQEKNLDVIDMVLENEDANFAFPEEVEEILMDAVVTYLKGNKGCKSGIEGKDVPIFIT